MEVALILETSTDFLLFGIEEESIVYLSEYIRGKSRGEQLFVQRVVETVLNNVIEKRELMEVEGGVIDWAVIGGIASVVAIYMGVREVVRDAGASAAYKELGY